jgi:hypothetical protein
MIEPSTFAREMLKRNGASNQTIEASIRMTNCLYEAAEDVAASTDDDELYDDRTSRGQLLYRRARNRMIAEFSADTSVEASTAENALHVYAGGAVLSFYSAPNGLERPMLAGSQTKRTVVGEMQLQLESSDERKLRRLVLMHEADEEGLIRVALGVLRNGRDWVWRATMYDRYPVASSLADGVSPRGYEDQDEAELPLITPREDSGADAEESQNE